MVKKKQKGIVYRFQYLGKNNKTYVYIGKTERALEDREKEHKQNIINNSSGKFYEYLRSIAQEKWPNPLLEQLLVCDLSKLNETEKRLIEEHAKSKCVEILNSSGINCKNDFLKNEKNDFGIPKSSRQKNYDLTKLGDCFARISETKKPLINLYTSKSYSSLRQAAEGEAVSKSTIRESCNTGKKLLNNKRYAWLDINNQPILTLGHEKEWYIGSRNGRKIIELISGQVFNNIREVAQQYHLSEAYINDCAKGKYGIVKKSYVFAYLNESNNPIKTGKHSWAINKINNKNACKYIAWPVDFIFEEAQNNKTIGFFKNLGDLCLKLKIKNKSHIKEVCEGIRTHVEEYRIAFYDFEKKEPVLKSKHNQQAKKIVRKIYCVSDGNKFDNCTDAGKYYFVDPNQIGQCAKGIIKSVRVKNKDTGKTERYRFQYLDKSDNPIILEKHKESLSQRRNISRVLLINPATIDRLGKSTYSSIAEFCRETGVPKKRAYKYKKDNTINLNGYEFILI